MKTLDFVNWIGQQGTTEHLKLMSLKKIRKFDYSENANNSAFKEKGFLEGQLKYSINCVTKILQKRA